MSDWKTNEPPKSGTQFLADVGLPWAVVAAWNGFDEDFVYASLQCGMVEGICNDTYFETEREIFIKRWMPMPEFN